MVSVVHPILYQKFVNSNTITANPTHIKVIAHRGASSQAPENTLASIQTALDLNADMIEIDIHLTKDNKLIVLHDETLERTTNGTGNVSGYTLKELKTLDAGSWFSKEFLGEQLPTLAEVLALINGRAICLIEIKWEQEKPYHGIEEKIVNEIINHNAIAWTIVQSFESSYLSKINHINPEIKLGKLLTGSWNFPFPFHYDFKFNWGAYSPPSYISWVNFYYKRSTSSFIKKLHHKGVKVAVFTPNSKTDIIKQVNMGVDALITNDTQLGKRLLKN